MTSEYRLDHKRAERIGIGEAILCAGKSSGQIEAILADAAEQRASYLMTRLSEGAFDELDQRWRTRIDFDPISRTGIFDRQPEIDMRTDICVVTAGTSDTPVAREIERTLLFNRVCPTMIFDVGVAGLWRLHERETEIAAHAVVIAVAGMDGALPTVLAGLVPGAIIGVPTSTGYGVTRAGETALMAMLASCAPGLVTVNIDNGYGAACAALRILGQPAHGLTPAAGGG